MHGRLENGAPLSAKRKRSVITGRNPTTGRLGRRVSDITRGRVYGEWTGARVRYGETYVGRTASVSGNTTYLVLEAVRGQVAQRRGMVP